MTVMPPGGGAGAKPSKPPPIPKRKAPPPIPGKATKAGLGARSPKPSTRPATPPPVVRQSTPAAPTDSASTFVGGGTDLADVPAPTRSSPLAGAAPMTKPQERRSLLEQAGLTDAPTKSTARTSALSGVSDLPAPVAKQRDLVDLTTPVNEPEVSGLPAPVARNQEIADLPAPKASSVSALGGLPDSIDLPGDDDLSDLLAPVDRSHGPADDDLLAPLGSSHADLLAPKRNGPGADDLLAPKRNGPGADDLLTPKRSGPGADDLLTPKRSGLGADDLLTPKRSGLGADDLLTPKPDQPGDDLLTPKTGGSDNLPAPKGFFDDVPGPTPAAGGGETKGFFDDIPAPASAGPDLLASGQSEGAGGGSGSLDLDDLDLATPSAGGSPAPTLELGTAGGEPASFDLGGPNNAPMSLELSDDGPVGLELNPGSTHAESTATPLEFGDSAAPSFGEVDLPSPDSVVTFSDDPPAARAAARPAIEPAGELELDGDSRPKKKTTTAADLRDGGAKKRGKGDKGAKAEGKKPRLSGKKLAVVAAAILGVGVAGAGGWMYYQNRQDAKKKAARINRLLNQAERQLVMDTAGHWQQAGRVAANAHRRDKGNTRALALMAQAGFASYLDQGTPAAFAALPRAKQLISKLENKNASGRAMAKADALRALVDDPPNVTYALQKLTPLARNTRAKGPVQLYLGWAYATGGQHQNAIAAYRKAIEQNRNKVSATYWMGRSYLARGDAKAAREAFDKVRELDKGHVGALLGTYQLASLSLDDRIKRYEGLLKRKDIANADLRVRALANALIGNLKLRSGAIEEAKRRYDAALKLDPRNVPAKIGKAKAAYRLNRLSEARGTLESLLKTNSSHIEGLFVLARVAIAEGKLEEAQQHIDKVLKRNPPIKNDSILLEAQLLQGDIYAATAAREKDSDRKARDLDSAISAYTAAKKYAKASGDIRANVALTIVLTSHPDKQKQNRAAAELAAIETEAKEKPAVATKLGLAFLNAGRAAQAETWFRTALSLIDNVETRFQLGVALRRQNKYAEAIRQLRAAFRKNEAQEDIGLELAILYETKAAAARKAQNPESALGDEREARALYQRLLSAPKPSLNVRARAGLFYARLANLEAEHTTAAARERAKRLRLEAEKQGRIIVAEKRDNAAGNFLLGEGAFAQGDLGRARSYYRKAAQVDADPQYLEGLGRTFENLDPPAFDKARSNYVEAIKADPHYLPPRYGVIRVRMKNQNFGQALVELGRLDKLRPHDAWVWRNIGECHLKLRDAAKAVAAFSLAVAYGDDNPYTSYRLGRAYFDDNRTREATGALARASKLIERARRKAQADGKLYAEPPWTLELYRQLGYAYRERGERHAAIRAWREYLQRNPRDKAKAADVKKLLIRLGAH